MTIQGAIYELNNMLSSNDIPCYWKPAIKKIIETVEQNVGEMSEKQTDGDLISRQAVKDLIRKFKKGFAKTQDEKYFDYVIAGVELLPSAEKTIINPEKTTITNGDLISRQAVITMLQKIENAVEDGDGFQFNEWVEYAKDIPSAEKTAEWIEVIDEIDSLGNKTWHHECSICGNSDSGWGDYKYCPKCGCRMKGEQ